MSPNKEMSIIPQKVPKFESFEMKINPGEESYDRLQLRICINDIIVTLQDTNFTANSKPSFLNKAKDMQ